MLKKWSSKDLNPGVLVAQLVVFPLQNAPPTTQFVVLKQICDNLISLH